MLGPFLLTSLLLPALTAKQDARVLTMSSGGMYTAPLTVSRLQMSDSGSDDPYRGAEQYARAKRAQVTLTEGAETFRDPRAVSLAPPRWADTPGVEEALPTFRKVVGHSSAHRRKADTLVWLTADDASPTSNGRFWHDRAPRPIHRLLQTRRSDTPERRAKLWPWCVDRFGSTSIGIEYAPTADTDVKRDPCRRQSMIARSLRMRGRTSSSRTLDRSSALASAASPQRARPTMNPEPPARTATSTCCR